MINKIIEILKKNVVSFNDHDVIFGGDGDLTDLANELKEAIDYRCSCKSDSEQLQGFFDYYKQKFGGGFNTDVLEITLKQYKETL